MKSKFKQFDILENRGDGNGMNYIYKKTYFPYIFGAKTKCR